MRELFTALFFSLFALPALTQDTEELATKYVALSAVQEMIAERVSPEALATQFLMELPLGRDITEDQFNKVGDLMSAEAEDLKSKLAAMMIHNTASLLTAEELEALISFHSSEHGSAVMKKMQNGERSLGGPANARD